ncbi:MAG: hypothetical protein LWY06_13225 [Firmicutes bacterium]|nr:hypothetical protein [Bacillota bacterium]
MDGIGKVNYNVIPQSATKMNYNVVNSVTGEAVPIGDTSDAFKWNYNSKMDLLNASSAVFNSPMAPLSMRSEAADLYCSLTFGLITGAVGATLNSVRKTYADGLVYELGKLQGGKEIKQKINEEEVAEKNPYSDNAPVTITHDDIAEDLQNDAAAAAPGGQNKALIDTAGEVSEGYFNLGGKLVLDKVTKPITYGNLPEDTKITEGYSPEVNAVNLDELKWNKVDEYAQTRVGPLVEVLKTLGKNDEIRFSNLDFANSIRDINHNDYELAGQLNLPVSSWSKDVNVVLRKDGSRVVVLSDFAGKSLMDHFELLTKKVLDDQPEQPKVKIVESKSTFDQKYSALAGFFKNNSEELKGVDTVVVGYNQAFSEQWKDKFVKTVSDENSDWSASIYEMPDEKKTKVAVLESHASFHGEILGENLRQLVDNNPQIKNVFTAGSGGSLHIRSTYDLVFPAVVSGDDKSMNNVLSSGSDRQVHKSVISPLAETPSKLRKEINEGCTTMDMEMGYVAEALAGKDIKLGVGILVTDFPVERPISKGVSLTFQDSSKKYQSMKKYTDAVYNFITAGKSSPEHKVEQELGKPLTQLSKENLEWEMNSLGKMTPDEQLLFDRISALEPDYSFRMTPARLERVLDDGVILSTRQVKDIKGAEVKPFTPAIEDKMYDAFDYTYGSVAFHNGDPQYGGVVVKIKPEIWKNRSWATYRSGWRAVVGAGKELNSKDYDFDKASPEITKKAMEKMGTWVVTPEDYMKSMAAFTVKYLRNQDPALIQAFLKADNEQMKMLFAGNKDIGFLEGKIKGSMNLEDIQEVIIPQDCPQEVITKLRQKGIPIG